MIRLSDYSEITTIVLKQMLQIAINAVQSHSNFDQNQTEKMFTDSLLGPILHNFIRNLAQFG